MLNHYFYFSKIYQSALKTKITVNFSELPGLERDPQLVQLIFFVYFKNFETEITSGKTPFSIK